MGVLVLGAGVSAGAVALIPTDSDGESIGESATPTPCTSALHVVAASSFAPVLNEIAAALESAESCVHLEVDVADGRAAARRVVELGADVWIPDDAAWAGVAEPATFAEPSAGGPGTVLAASPIYIVSDEATAGRLEQAGGGWRGLADLVTGDPGVRLVVRDPAGSGDGLVAVGAVGEAVWLDAGMDASAEALATALPMTRTVPGHALPREDGEVCLVAEYALVPLLAEDGSDAASRRVRQSAVLAATDYTALMRYTWLPTAQAIADPAVRQPMERLLSALTGPEVDDALAAAGLRRPDITVPPGVSGLPGVEAPAFDVLGRHQVDHVFATWYAADRRADLLLVVDVSGSMGEPAEGSARALIDLVRDGMLALAELLPDDSELSVWAFGSRLDPPRDYQVLLPRAPLDAGQRQRLGDAAAALTARDTGTGLYDTILAAYVAARDGYRDGVANQVVVFTDGHNQDDPGSISAEQLSEQLIAAADPQRPVQLTVITFGSKPEAQVLEGALEPVEGYVDPLTRADEVRAVFIHVAAGGVHH
jgi:hypothetical protein